MFKNNGTTKDENSSTNPMPQTYIPQTGELKAKLVTPRKLFLFWDFSNVAKRVIELFSNYRLEEHVTVIRIYDVTDLIFNGRNAHHYFEITVPYQMGHWFVKGLAANRCYVAELGIQMADTGFFPLFRSKCLQTPIFGITGESGLNYDILQFHRYEENPPKWLDYVSTYSYYLDAKNMKEN
ncbi:DUF4912 domain-containing protein [Neobacillus bataviensis]|uniref:DUF4912 domain-containing protein n=1 Tax=Neobacillus bataviensis TaxID=220685 RepID=UPI001CBE78D7|nr:DUF4912 domain-containing protein [Neobacillus bataviensis]